MEIIWSQRQFDKPFKRLRKFSFLFSLSEGGLNVAAFEADKNQKSERQTVVNINFLLCFIHNNNNNAKISCMYEHSTQ